MFNFSCSISNPKCSYYADSPPDNLKHLVVWCFWLSFPGDENEESVEPSTKRTKKPKKEKAPSPFVNPDLRIFVTLPSRNNRKRKEPAPKEVLFGSIFVLLTFVRVGPALMVSLPRQIALQFITSMCLCVDISLRYNSA